MKAVNNNNDHVMAFEANVSLDTDSHLVCVQNADGKYQTQAINIQNKPRKSESSDLTCLFEIVIHDITNNLL